MPAARFLQLLHSEGEGEGEGESVVFVAMVQCAAMEVAAEVRRPAVVAGGGGGGGGARAERESEGLPCPRCESTNTKFCYYNNYNMAQPRHFCKGCRRYWTRGGALRNVPVGGGTRKATPAARRKRASSHSHSHAPSAAGAGAAASPAPISVVAPAPVGATLTPRYELSFVPGLPPPAHLAAIDPDRQLLDLGGSFSSLLAPAPLPNAHFAAGFLLGGPGAAAATQQLAPPAPAPPLALPPPASQAMPEGIWCMGWPDLSI